MLNAFQSVYVDAKRDDKFQFTRLFEAIVRQQNQFAKKGIFG